MDLVKTQLKSLHKAVVFHQKDILGKIKSMQRYTNSKESFTNDDEPVQTMRKLISYNEKELKLNSRSFNLVRGYLNGLSYFDIEQSTKPNNRPEKVLFDMKEIMRSFNVDDILIEYVDTWLATN